MYLRNENTPQIHPPMCWTIVLSVFTDVFQGPGTLATEYTIELKKEVRHVVNPPRKVPVAQHEVVKQELNRMFEDQVITPITRPTPTHMVIISNKNGNIHNCLDLRDLKITLSTFHYWRGDDQTLECCKWSSMNHPGTSLLLQPNLVTRVLFGINSAPEVSQPCMN